MKKLTTSVLAIVLSSSFVMVNAQEKKKDSVRNTREMGGVTLVAQPLGLTKKKDAVTSSYQVVSNETLTQAANSNAVSALAGKVSGLRITQSNSSVTGTNSIIIRSPRSITGNNEALIVIDGVISTATVLQQLPPDVIESTNVIKGAAGAALYGPQGINGAIIVTTKRGTKSRKLKVNFNSSVDFESVAFLPTRQREYGQGWDGVRISVENGSWGPSFSDPNHFGQLLNYGAGFKDLDGDGIITVNPNDATPTADDASAIMSRYTPYGNDNVEDFFQIGTLFQNTLTLNAGDQSGYVMLNLNHVDREFIIKDDTMKRFGVMFKAGKTIKKWKLDTNLNYIRRKTSTTDNDVYRYLLQSSPDIPINKFAGTGDRGMAWNMYYANPYFYINHVRYNNLRNYFSALASVQYTLNDHVNFIYRGNIQYTTNEYSGHNDGWVGDDSNIFAKGGGQISIESIATSSYKKESYNDYRYYGDFLANFNYDLTTNLNMIANLGHNYQERRWSYVEAGGTGIIIPGLYQIWNISNPTAPTSLNNNRYFQNSHALFANIDLGYKDYVFLNLVGRYEMNSLLPNDERDFFYPAVSFSFIPTKAFDGLKSSTLNYLKITGAIQKTGNATAIGVYDVNKRFSTSSGWPYPDKTQLSFGIDQTQTYSHIKPEFTVKKEVGVEAGLFKNRIKLNAALYREDTTDLITQTSASYASGIRTSLINIGELYNQGLDLNLDFTPIKTKNIRWDVGVNYTISKTQVTRVTDDSKEVYLGGYAGVAGVYAIEGEAFPVLKATVYKRDDKGRIIVDATTGLPQYSSQMVKVGQTTPKYIIGLNTSLKVKGFKLSATMDYRDGHKFFSGTLRGYTFSGNNVASAGFDRTQPYIIPNSSYLNTTTGTYVANTAIPVYANTTNSAAGAGAYSALREYFSGSNHDSVGENFIFDASAFKLREIALSYTFDRRGILKGTGVNELTIGVHARNPFTKFASDNKNYDDPETSFDSSIPGIVNGAGQYPTVKSYGASISISF